MNAESKDSIYFDEKIFTNKQAKTQRNGLHQIPLLLASRKNRKFTLPAILVLDEYFRIEERKFEYMTAAELLEI